MKDELVTAVVNEIEKDSRSLRIKVHMAGLAKTADILQDISQNMGSTGITPQNVDNYRQMLNDLHFRVCDDIEFYRQALHDDSTTETTPDYERARVLLNYLNKQMRESPFNQ